MRYAYFLISLICIFLILLSIKPIKGNGDSMIYHMPGCTSYGSTVIGNHPADQTFFTEKAAIEAGFRKANNCT